MQMRPQAVTRMARSEGVVQLRPAGVGPCGGYIDLRRAAHGERLVVALSVEFLDQAIETVLLLATVHAGRACGLLLPRQAHALVAAVLVRVAGLDALEGDAEPQPPHGRLRQVVEPLGLAKGSPLSERIAAGRPRSLNRRTKASMTGPSYVDAR